MWRHGKGDMRAREGWGLGVGVLTRYIKLTQKTEQGTLSVICYRFTRSRGDLGSGFRDRKSQGARRGLCLEWLSLRTLADW